MTRRCSKARGACARFDCLGGTFGRGFRRRQIIIYSNIYSPSPCFLRFNAADFRHDVYHHRWRAHAKEVIGLREVLGAQSFNRRSELRERCIHGFAVFSVCANQNIQIFGCTWLRMKRNRISANNQISNLAGVESG